MSAYVRERRSKRHGTRYMVVWRPTGTGARLQPVRSAGTFSNLAAAERARDQVNGEIARGRPPGYTPARGEGEKLVYIAAFGGLLKIGVSIDPVQRFSDLPGVQILHVEHGGFARERELHHRFKHLRVAGEWFRPGRAGEIRRYIARMKSRPGAVTPEAPSADKEREQSVA